VASVVILFLQAVKMAIVENLSTTTNTQSLPCLVEGRPTYSPSRWIPKVDQEYAEGVQAFLLNGCFDNGVGGARSDLLTNIQRSFDQ